MTDSVHGLSDDHLKEIGRVAVEWSLVEATIEIMIWTLLFVNPSSPSPWHDEREGRAVTTHVALLLKLDMLLSLARVRFDIGDHNVLGFRRTDGSLTSIIEELSDLTAAIKRALPKRNSIVHATWASVSAETALQQSYKARGKLVPVFNLTSASAIAAVADEIAGINQRLTAFHQNVILPIRAGLQPRPF